MASSKVMVSSSPANPDLPHQSSIHPLTVSDLQTDQSKNFGSMNMDELLKNMYNDSEPFPVVVDAQGGEALSTDTTFSMSKNAGSKSVDEVWKEIVAGGGAGAVAVASGEPNMTLEDFLTKAGAVREDEVRMRDIPPPQPGFGVDSIVNASQFPALPPMPSSRNGPAGYCVDSVGFGNEIVGVGTGGGGGRGKRRVVEEPPVDKATQQKQRRMIKNRESAARSRERKQAYTVELEALVTQLEEENSRLIKEEAEATKERFNKLMKTLIPVVEQRRPPRALRRTNSM